MKVALYARVSTYDNDQNPKNQLIKLREYAENHGWEIYDEYVDEASGSAPSRPEFDKMHKDARAHRFNAILAVKIDRIGRTASHLLNLLDELEDKRIQLLFTDQDIDTSSPSGKLFFTILSGVAEIEREHIRERTKDGLERARAEGKRLGRPPNPAKTEEILALQKTGMSLRQIGERIGMTRQGVRQRLYRHRKQNGIPKET